MFLPDRYIKGECPNCHAKDQYGDACEVCGTVYSPTELIEPVLDASGAKPVLKSLASTISSSSRTRKLRRVPARMARDARAAAAAGRQQGQASGFDGDGDQALGDWDISRDAPYFGIQIPDAPGKFFYVWLDAPVGYLASLKNYFDSGKARAKRRDAHLRRFLARPDDRADPLHRQGHHLLPHAVLARDAAVRRRALQGAGPRLRARLHHRPRREDVQVARHRHHPAALSRDRHESRMAALLHRGQAERATSRTSTSTPTTSSRASTATWSASTSTSPAARRLHHQALRRRAALQRQRR